MRRGRTYRRLLEDTMTALALRCPLPRPVRMRIVDKASTHGTTSLERDGFIIEISRGNRHLMLDTLIHEWAHARSWGRGKVHGDRWGREYARVYRLIMGED